MSIDQLLQVVAPPESPVETDDGESWEMAQQALGTKLPSDFREFGLHYGTGRFCGYLGVLNPLSGNFEPAIKYLLETLRDNKSSRNYPYDVFPDSPGLLPWGGDENGQMLNWLTDGDADSWPVVVESHEGELERFDMTMTTFLAKALSNEIRPAHIWGRPFTQDELFFVPQS